MLDIKKTIENGKALFALTGRLDTTTAPELEKAIKDSFNDLNELTLDFAGLEYVSSAGLRVLIEAHMNMALKEGRMELKNVNETIMEIFDITGFTDVLTIK